MRRSHFRKWRISWKRLRNGSGLIQLHIPDTFSIQNCSAASRALSVFREADLLAFASFSSNFFLWRSSSSIISLAFWSASALCTASLRTRWAFSSSVSCGGSGTGLLLKLSFPRGRDGAASLDVTDSDFFSVEEASSFLSHWYTA